MCCFFWMASCLLEGTNSFVKVDESARFVIIISKWKERCGYWGGPCWTMWASSRRVWKMESLSGCKSADVDQRYFIN